MSAATKARTAGVISASISGGTIIGLAIVDDMIVHVVAENAVHVQISFFPGRLPGLNNRERWRAANEQRPFVRDAAAVESMTLPPAVSVTRRSLAVACRPLEVAPRRRTLVVAR